MQTAQTVVKELNEMVALLKAFSDPLFPVIRNRSMSHPDEAVTPIRIQRQHHVGYQEAAALARAVKLAMRSV